MGYFEPMTALHAYAEFVKERGFRVTLGEIMGTKFACEYRKYATLMRRDGWVVEVKINRKEPGKNIYTFVEPARFKFTAEGQGVLV